MHEKPTTARGFHGLRVVAFESRRAVEIAELIRRYDGEPISAPSMREIPLGANRAAFDYMHDLDTGRIDIVVLMTGVGLRLLADTVATEWPLSRFVAAMKKTKLVARGPKPVAVLRTLGLDPDLVVPEPNTWREMLQTLDTKLPVTGKRLAVQEYGISNRPFLEALEQRGANVRNVSIYRWALPEDLQPLHEAIARIRAGTADVALFTSATQVYHLLQVASPEEDQLRAALNQLAVASIGPVCSEALRENGIAPDIEPEHSKMGPLVSAAATRAAAVLARKRAIPTA